MRGRAPDYATADASLAGRTDSPRVRSADPPGCRRGRRDGRRDGRRGGRRGGRRPRPRAASRLSVMIACTIRAEPVGPERRAPRRPCRRRSPLALGVAGPSSPCASWTARVRAARRASRSASPVVDLVDQARGRRPAGRAPGQAIRTSGARSSLPEPSVRSSSTRPCRRRTPRAGALLSKTHRQNPSGRSALTSVEQRGPPTPWPVRRRARRRGGRARSAVADGVAEQPTVALGHPDLVLAVGEPAANQRPVLVRRVDAGGMRRGAAATGRRCAATASDSAGSAGRRSRSSAGQSASRIDLERVRRGRRGRSTRTRRARRCRGARSPAAPRAATAARGRAAWRASGRRRR